MPVHSLLRRAPGEMWPLALSLAQSQTCGPSTQVPPKETQQWVQGGPATYCGHTRTPFLCSVVKTGAFSVGRTRKQLLSFTNVLLQDIFSLGFLLNSLKFPAPECCLEETPDTLAKNYLPLRMPVLPAQAAALRMVRSRNLPSAAAFAFRGAWADGVREVGRAQS